MMDHKERALRDLNALRMGIPPQYGSMGRLRKAVEAGGLTLSDIGTSEEELKELPMLRSKAKCEKEARELLNDLRRGGNYHNFRETLKNLRESVEEAGLSLDDIGTSEEELKELCEESCRKFVQFNLIILANGTIDEKRALANIEREIEFTGLTIKELAANLSGDDWSQLKRLLIRAA